MSEDEEYYDIEEKLETCNDHEDLMKILQNITKELQGQKTAYEKGLQDQKAAHEKELQDQKTAYEKGLQDQKAALEKGFQDQKAALEKGFLDLRAEIKNTSKPETCEFHHHGVVVLRSGLGVVCDGRWIVLQRRTSAQVSFDRNW